MADTLVAVAGVVSPGLGALATMVSAIGAHCNDVHEAKSLCRQFHGQLDTLQQQMERLEIQKRLPKSDAIDKYRNIVRATYDEITLYKDMRFLTRLVNYRKLKKTLEGLNDDVVELFRMVDLETTGIVMDLQATALEIQKAFNENAVSVMNDLRGVKAQGEALLLLTYERENHNAEQPQETKAILEATYRKVRLNAEVSSVDVPKWFLSSADISFGSDVLGEGAFGKVCRGTWKGGASVAVKFLLPEDHGFDAPTANAFKKEADIWWKLIHPNVTRMWGACHISSTPFMVCEFAPKGDLMNYLASEFKGAENKRYMWKLLLEAAQGLQFLHSMDVVHGDLKLNNILVGEDGQARVTDFGLSLVKASSKTYVNKLKPGEVVVGGSHWMAPELFEQGTTKYSDIYAFGMCLIEAVTGLPPYQGLEPPAIQSKIKAGIRPERPVGMSDAAWDLVVAMTNPQKRERISLELAIAKLALLAKAEKEERELNQLVCHDCIKQLPLGSKFCFECGVPLGEAVLITANSGRLPPLQNVLEDLSKESKKTSAVKLLYRHTATAASCVTINDSVSVLQEITSGSDAVRALYAFGCISTLAEAGLGLSEKDLDALRGQEVWKAEDAVAVISCLLAPEAGAKRDDLQALELIELLIKFDSRNRHVVGDLVPQLASVLKESTGDVRAASVHALAAVVLTDLTSEYTSSLDDLSKADVIPSLVAVLRESGSQVTAEAAHLLAELTKSRGLARECATGDAIDAVLAVLRRETGAAYEYAMRVVANLVKLTDKRDVIGSRGAVYDLVDVLKLGATDDRVPLAFEVLGLLVRDEGNAWQFERAGGVRAVESLLSGRKRRAETLENLASMAETSEYLRHKLASNATILNACVESLKPNKHEDDERSHAETTLAAARACREFVQENPSVIQAIDAAGGLEALETLARADNFFASKALVYAIQTQQKALMKAGVLQPLVVPTVKTAALASESNAARVA